MADEPMRQLALRVAAITALSRRLVDAALRAPATSGCELQREDAVELADRVRGRRGWRELAWSPPASPRLRGPSGTGTAAAPARRRTVYSGSVEVEVGPLPDFAQLTRFEDAVASIDSGGDVQLRNFADGRATFSVSFAEPLELVKELEQRAPFPFSVRDRRVPAASCSMSAGATRRARRPSSGFHKFGATVGFARRVFRATFARKLPAVSGHARIRAEPQPEGGIAEAAIALHAIKAGIEVLGRWPNTAVTTSPSTWSADPPSAVQMGSAEGRCGHRPPRGFRLTSSGSVRSTYGEHEIDLVAAYCPRRSVLSASG